jgi:rRNA processing protein Gar1
MHSRRPLRETRESDAEEHMTAQTETKPAPGDVVEVSGRRVRDAGRSGVIREVLGPEEHPHYVVRWEDGHESVLYPGEGTTVRKARRTRR